MPDVTYYSPVVSALVTLLLTAWMLRARDHLPLDIPNPRSLHVRPVPRSGGIAMMAGIFAGFALMQTPLVVVVPAAALVALSRWDDVRGLPVRLRFAVQLLACAGFAYAALPLAAAPLVVLAALAALWATNLYNFMDGADGLAASMALFGFSFLGVGAWLSGDQALTADCAIVAAASAAFLVFNFPAARVFMGDAGSIPIGFLAAAVALVGVRDGDWPFWFPAVVFAPFVADATVTLLRRIAAGERIWEAHRQHYYQRLVRMGWSHRRTTLAECGLMLVCGVTAVWAVRQPPHLQAGAVAAVAVLVAALAVWVETAWRRHESSRAST
jgi:UDP-GlcNAc:undecaprenyl-phosphate/decaprenyl-phosphate GlcNAc-1-phosphate transferase